MSTFLYKTGDECIGITGGFISCPYTLAGTSISVIKNSDNIQLNPNGIGKHTSLSHSTAVDLTEYKGIYFDIEVVSTLGSNQWSRLGLSTNNNQNDYGVGEVAIENQVGRKLYYIDLTDKTGLAFVKAHINCGAGAVGPFMNIKIYNIWLEKTLEKLPTSTDLSNAIQYNKNINNEISTLKIKLKNNLTGKGVECSDKDKFHDLINKVTSISTGKKWASGSLTIDRLSSNNGVVQSKRINCNLNFIPRFVFIGGAYVSFREYDYTMAEHGLFISNLDSVRPSSTSNNKYVSITELSETGFTINVLGVSSSNFTGMSITNGSWYAFE